MKIVVKLLLLMAVVGYQVLAELPDEAEFSVDSGLVDQIFADSVDQSLSPAGHTPLKALIGFGFSQPSDWRLANNYHEINYAENTGSIPSLALSLERSLGDWQSVYFSGTIRGGVGYQSGVYEFKSTSGQVRRDNISVYQLPVSVETAASIIAIWDYLEIKIAAGAGMQWIYQSGNLDGFTQGFWVPFVVARPSIVLWPKHSRSEGWFAGLSLGGAYYGSFGSDQNISGTGLELGVNITI